MRAQIKENIKKFRSENPDTRMNMRILSKKVFAGKGGTVRSNYELIVRYNRGAKSYKLEYLFAICKELNCLISELIKYES